jgi:four helix bundle protein
MNEIKSYRDLIVWQKAMEFVRLVYVLSRDFPRDEQFGLTSQLRRSAVSIPSNVAEGHGRGSTADYLRFLFIARGSLFEAQTQIEVAQMLGFAHTSLHPEIFPLSSEIEKMLNALIRNLSR